MNPRGDSNFGWALPDSVRSRFDPVFQPVGATKTLAEDKPDEYSARAKAVESFVRDQPYAIVNPIFDWDGEYQE